MKIIKDLILNNSKQMKNGLQVCNISFSSLPFDDGTILDKAPEELLSLFAVKKNEIFIRKDSQTNVTFVSIENSISWKWKTYSVIDIEEFWQWLEKNSIWLIGSFLTFEKFNNSRILGTILNPIFRPKKILCSNKFRKIN